MHRPRVLLADDHAMFREGIALLLAPEADVVGSAADGLTLVQEAHRLDPDIIVTDLGMPGLDGIEVARRLRADGLHCRIIVLTVHVDPAIAAAAIRAGALGFVVKHAAGEELVEALRAVARGRTFVSPLVAGEVVARLAHGTLSPEEGLTPRQREVLRHLALGHRVKEVADALGLSVRTVEAHKYEVMRILGVDSTVDLVRYAIRHGIVDP